MTTHMNLFVPLQRNLGHAQRKQLSSFLGKQQLTTEVEIKKIQKFIRFGPSCDKTKKARNGLSKDFISSIQRLFFHHLQ